MVAAFVAGAALMVCVAAVCVPDDTDQPESIATPALPTSPTTRSLSES